MSKQAGRQQGLKLDNMLRTCNNKMSVKERIKEMIGMFFIYLSTLFINKDRP